MKKTLLILGFSVAVGAVTYTLLQRFQKYQTAIAVSADKGNEYIPISDTETTPDQELTSNDIEIIRKVAKASVIERHEEAAQIIKDAVEVICKQSYSQNNELEKLNQITNGLDDLLKED